MLFLSPSSHGVPYGESLHEAPLVKVLLVNGDPRKYIYKVKVMYNYVQPLDVADGREALGDVV